MSGKTARPKKGTTAETRVRAASVAGSAALPPELFTPEIDRQVAALAANARPRPPVMRAVTYRKGRYVVMTRLDARAFTRALRDIYPGLVFVDLEQRTVVPSLEFARATVWGFVPSSSCTAEVFLRGCIPPWTDIPKPHFSFRPSVSYRGSDEPLEQPGPRWINQGRVDAMIEPGDRDTARLIGRVLRTLAKVTTNKVYMVNRTTGAMRPDFGGFNWYGFHALQLQRENPFYELDGDRVAPPGWVMPDLPWYK